jgi:hypothetical protein
VLHAPAARLTASGKTTSTLSGGVLAALQLYYLLRLIHSFPATTLSQMTIGSKSVASPGPDAFAMVL